MEFTLHLHFLHLFTGVKRNYVRTDIPTKPPDLTIAVPIGIPSFIPIPILFLLLLGYLKFIMDLILLEPLADLQAARFPSQDAHTFDLVVATEKRIHQLEHREHELLATQAEMEGQVCPRFITTKFNKILGLSPEKKKKKSIVLHRLNSFENRSRHGRRKLPAWVSYSSPTVVLCHPLLSPLRGRHRVRHAYPARAWSSLRCRLSIIRIKYLN